MGFVQSTLICWYYVNDQTSLLQAVSVHDSLAVRVCNEILRDVSAPEVRLYCKTLSWLEINTEPGPTNNELQLLLKDILQVLL